MAAKMTSSDFDALLLRFSEMFSGGGGVGLGATRAGFTVTYANDVCKHKAKTFRANFPDVHLDTRSIAEVRAEDIGQVEAMGISSPCSDHSVQGFKAGFEGGERGVLAFHALRIVKEMAERGYPPHCLAFENVVGLLSTFGGKDFASLCQGLVNLGYEVGALVINARQFVPQNRERVFIVAVLRGTEIPRALKSGKPHRMWHPPILLKAHAALSPAARSAWHWWTLPRPAPMLTRLADIVEQDVPDSLWESPEEHIAGLTAKGHTLLAETVAQGGGVGVALVKRRTVKGGGTVKERILAMDGYARCLMKSEGHERQRLFFVSGDGSVQMRDFTPRERARLTGLPEDYKLPCKTRTQHLTGDAVVVPAYEHLARHLLIPLVQAARSAIPARPLPRRQITERDVVHSRGNRGKKRACHSGTVYLLPEAHERLRTRAQAAGRTMEEELLSAYDRMLLAEGDVPLPRYAPARCGGGGKTKQDRSEQPQPPRHAVATGEDMNPRRVHADRGAGARSRIGQASTPIRHPGGKAKAASFLIRTLGATSSLIEPFAGSAAVAVRAVMTGAVSRAVLAEKDEGLRTFWRLVASGGDAEVQRLLAVLERAEPSREWWRRFEERVAADPALHMVAARALLAGRFHWGGIPCAGLVSDAELAKHWRADTMIRRIEGIRMHGARFEVLDDAFSAIRANADDDKAAFFVDPPYSLPGGPGRRLYRHHDVDHQSLMGLLSKVRGWVVATYDDRPEVRSLAANHGFAVGSLRIRDAHRRGRTELLLTRGRPPP